MKLKSKSWIDLEPLRVKYGNKELFEDFYARINQKIEFLHIPEIVFKQWLWAHHNKEESIKNYGWINYETVEFKLCIWSNKQLTNVYVIEKYRDYYEERASYDEFDNFFCTPDDLNEWKTNGTWRTPPIILDVNSTNGNFPNWSELIPPYQLVEGHSRLGYLHSMIRMDKLKKGKVAEKHAIYLMSLKTTNF